MTAQALAHIAELSNIEAPTLFANGGPEDVAYPTSRNNYELADVPAALVEYSTGGHHGMTSGSTCRPTTTGSP